MSLADRRLPLLTTPGVRKIVGTGGTPTAVPESEIDAVRAIVTSGLATRPWPFVEVGDRVRLRGGSLDGVEGILIATKTHHRLVVSVEILHRSVAVEIDQAWVEAVGSQPRVK
jgi:transcription antitermination factor NusG